MLEYSLVIQSTWTGVVDRRELYQLNETMRAPNFPSSLADRYLMSLCLAIQHDKKSYERLEDFR